MTGAAGFYGQLPPPVACLLPRRQNATTNPATVTNQPDRSIQNAIRFVLASVQSVAMMPVPKGRLAQLARAPARHAGGHRFESCNAHHFISQARASRVRAGTDDRPCRSGDASGSGAGRSGASTRFAWGPHPMDGIQRTGPIRIVLARAVPIRTVLGLHGPTPAR